MSSIEKDKTVTTGIIVVFLIFIIICIYLLYPVKMIPAPQVSAEKSSIIQSLVRQSGRWSISATQDASPLIAILHANYGAAYLWALQSIATDSEIKAVTGINSLEFQNKITSVQDNATKNMIKQCPRFSKNIDPELAAISGQ